jgi:hypothetical protein
LVVGKPHALGSINAIVCRRPTTEARLLHEDNGDAKSSSHKTPILHGIPIIPSSISDAGSSKTKGSIAGPFSFEDHGFHNGPIRRPIRISSSSDGISSSGSTSGGSSSVCKSNIGGIGCIFLSIGSIAGVSSLNHQSLLAIIFNILWNVEGIDRQTTGTSNYNHHQQTI